MRVCRGIHAAALVDGADDQSDHQGGATPAIRVRLEHVETDPKVWYLPYRISGQKVVRGELSRAAGQPLIFA